MSRKNPCEIFAIQKVWGQKKIDKTCQFDIFKYTIKSEAHIAKHSPSEFFDNVNNIQEKKNTHVTITKYSNIDLKKHDFS